MPDKTAAQRSLVVDVVRGLAISLVAFGHTNQGLIHRGWWGQSQVGEQLNRFIYAFHMPAFFFVSGIFIHASIVKRGPVKFVNTKIAQMIYPYFLWSILQYLLAFLLVRFIHQANPGPKEFLFDLLTGVTLWFLPAIFICVVLGMFLRNVNKPLLFALAVLVSLLPLHSNINFIVRSIEHFPYLVAGMWVALSYKQLERVAPAVAALGSLILAGLVFSVTGGFVPNRPWLAVPVGLVGTAMLLLVARFLQHNSFARALAWVGEASFGIYLLSAYGQGFGREVLAHGLHITEPYLQLVVPSLLAIAAPAWVYHHRARLRLGWLFLWPF